MNEWINVHSINSSPDFWWSQYILKAFPYSSTHTRCSVNGSPCYAINLNLSLAALSKEPAETLHITEEIAYCCHCDSEWKGARLV